MQSDFGPCDRCGEHFDYRELDGKPARFDRWWWFLLPWRWANRLLNLAADRGEQFEGLYCQKCYGPGYNDI